MDGIRQWIQNLTFFFIFLSAVMNFLPKGEEKKYVRFFMGMLLLLIIIKPLLQLGNMETVMKQKVLAGSIEETFEEIMRESVQQDITGMDYIKNACEREMKEQIKQLMQEYGYEVKTCSITFFEGDALELQSIRLKVKKTENQDQTAENAKADAEKFLKNRIEEVYKIPGGNINISIQGLRMKDRIIAICRKMKREQWIVCGLAGLLLLVIATPVRKTDSSDTAEKNAKEEDVVRTESQLNSIRSEYEQQLTEALSQVEGVGEVNVTVTMESTGKKIVEKDIPQDEQTSSQKDNEGMENSTQSSSTQETTVYEENENGSQTPYISSETYPEIRGVLVVAKGGGDPVIVQQIQEAVMALFHVDAHKIKVLKMK